MFGHDNGKLFPADAFINLNIVHNTLHVLHLSWQAIHVTTTHMLAVAMGGCKECHCY